jgi:hypothetical protein
MRNHAVSIMFGPLLLLCAVPGLAQPVTPPDKDVGAKVVETSPPTTEHDTYIQKTRNELSVWRGRFDEFGADAKGATVTAGNDADRDLHAAWADFQTASLKLQSVGADGWAAAKATYERASDGLANAWHRVHPEKT